jgi:hypothetical protein
MRTGRGRRGRAGRRRVGRGIVGARRRERRQRAEGRHRWERWHERCRPARCFVGGGGSAARRSNPGAPLRKRRPLMRRGPRIVARARPRCWSLHRLVEPAPAAVASFHFPKATFTEERVHHGSGRATGRAARLLLLRLQRVALRWRSARCQMSTAHRWLSATTTHRRLRRRQSAWGEWTASTTRRGRTRRAAGAVRALHGALRRTR